MTLHNFLSGKYNKIYVGLVDTSRAVRNYATILPIKLKAMEEVYLYKNTEYSEIERKQIIYLREAFSYKFYLIPCFCANRAGFYSLVQTDDILIGLTVHLAYIGSTESIIRKLLLTYFPEDTPDEHRH